MKLYDFLQMVKEDEELTVVDEEYDMETYFYNNNYSDGQWNNALIDLSKKLEVFSVSDGTVSVDLSNVIEKNLKALKKADLFIYCNIEAIMESMESILAGNVGEDWLVKFVNCLK